MPLQLIPREWVALEGPVQGLLQVLTQIPFFFTVVLSSQRILASPFPWSWLWVPTRLPL